jgi:hypothetical protein
MEVFGMTRFYRSRRFASAAMLALAATLAPPASAQLNCNVGVEFYPDDGIKRCILNGYHTWQPLVQYRGGALQSCTIEKAHTFGDVRCEAPARIEFEPDGRFRDCQPS